MYSKVAVLPQPFLYHFGRINSLDTMSFPKNREDSIIFMLQSCGEN